MLDVTYHIIYVFNKHSKTMCSNLIFQTKIKSKGNSSFFNDMGNKL